MRCGCIPASLGLRMVEELLAARGIIVSHETVRQWARLLVILRMIIRST